MSISMVRDGPLWIAHLLTRYGHMELLCGEEQEPDVRTLVFVEQFLGDEFDHIAAVRRSAFALPWLWRPIRIAINKEGRLGLQFKHRLSGRQDGMYFADEHSTFQSRLANVIVDEGDADRFGKRDGPHQHGA